MLTKTVAPGELVSLVRARAPPSDVLHDDDVQACLTTLYELHLQGLVGVSDEWEWNLDLLTTRAAAGGPVRR